MLYTLFITNDNIPEGSAGCAKAWFIYIRPGYQNDIGLIEHEKMHIWQFWRTLCLFHIWAYRFSKRYRLNCEVEAFRKQLEYAEDKLASRQHFAGFLSTKYGLDISEAEAYKLL